MFAEEEPPDKPLFQLWNVDVMYLNQEEKQLRLLVHVECNECEVHSNKIKSKVKSAVDRANQYLSQEGFLTFTKEWFINVGLKVHPPKE